MKPIKPTRLAIALFELRTDPPISLLSTFVMGLLIVGTVTSFFYDLIKGSPNFGGLPLMLIYLVIAVLCFNIYQSHSAVAHKISENPAVPQMRNVITVLSPYAKFEGGNTNLDVVQRMIAHHYGEHGDGKLQQLYLVCALKTDKNGNVEPLNENDKSSKGVVEAYLKLTEWMNSQFATSPLVEIIEVQDTNSGTDSFAKVSALLEKLSVTNSETLKNTVIDVTPGTKRLSEKAQERERRRSMSRTMAA